VIRSILRALVVLCCCAGALPALGQVYFPPSTGGGGGGGFTGSLTVYAGGVYTCWTFTNGSLTSQVPGVCGGGTTIVVLATGNGLALTTGNGLGLGN
jgi:hypothetical protein